MTSMSRRARALTVWLAAAAPLLLAGCGGSGDGGAAQAATTTTIASHHHHGQIDHVGSHLDIRPRAPHHAGRHVDQHDVDQRRPDRRHDDDHHHAAAADRSAQRPQRRRAGDRARPAGDPEAIGVDMTMYEGIRLTTLDYGPGHWPGSAMPGQAGNIVVGGHRTSKHKVFRNIDDLVAGDEIVFTDAAGSATPTSSTASRSSSPTRCGSSTRPRRPRQHCSRATLPARPGSASSCSPTSGV